MKFWQKCLAAGAGAAAGLGLLESYWELHNFVMTDYEIRSEKLKGLGKEKRVLFLSDLHNHVYGKNNDTLLQAIRDAGPDLILIGGDMIVSYEHYGCIRTTAFLKELPKIAPVYCANGNHEQRAKEAPEHYSLRYDTYKKELEEAGIRFLENESADLAWEDAKVRLTGLEIPSRCYTHLRRIPLYRADLYSRIGKPDPDRYEILLAHNPAYIKEYKAWGADLILSGHLHGGVVRIPGFRGAITPDLRIFPKYSGGLYQEDGVDIVVSRGLGTHTINFRLFNPAEVVCLTFKPSGEEN